MTSSVGNYFQATEGRTKSQRREYKCKSQKSKPNKSLCTVFCETGSAPHTPFMHAVPADSPALVFPSAGNKGIENKKHVAADHPKKESKKQRTDTEIDDIIKGKYYSVDRFQKEWIPWVTQVTVNGAH